MKKILISGGGTGGHIFPAISIANAIKRRWPSAEILFVGAENRMEMDRVPDAGYRIIGLPVAGFDRKNLLRNITVLGKLWQSMTKAKKILRDYQPDIAIGVGGYASGPMLKAAQRAGIPTLIQEQNSYPGVTNKLLGKKAKAICAAYDGLDRYFPADKITLTGNPVRKDLTGCQLSQAEAKQRLGFDAAKPLVLAVGGSLGARTINDSLQAGLQRLTDAGLQLLWQTGKYNAEACVEAAKGYENVKVTKFIDDMALAYRAADLVVSRAGAGTISELQLLAKPVILVPSPNVAEDHQRKNAQALVDKDAAVMVLDVDARNDLVDTIVKLAADRERLEALSAAIATMAQADADEKIVDIVARLLEEAR